MTIQSHKDLEVWQVSMNLVTQIYDLTRMFPREEIYGLTSQIRRSAISIPSNIAEGRAKRSTKDFMRFINIAYGSLAELETQLLIGKNLGYVSQKQLEPTIEKVCSVGRMLNKMLSSLSKKMDIADPRMPIPDPLKRGPSDVVSNFSFQQE